MSQTERPRVRRAGILAALFACLSILGTLSPGPANAVTAEDLFVICFGTATAINPDGAMHRCFTQYMDNIAPRSRRACRRGCRRLKRKLRTKCKQLGNRHIICHFGGRQIARACRHACRGKRCKALCLAERIERMSRCGKHSRKARKCRRHARRKFRRCRRHCRR
jgi:hypothetical protein